MTYIGHSVRFEDRSVFVAETWLNSKLRMKSFPKAEWPCLVRQISGSCKLLRDRWTGACICRCTLLGKAPYLSYPVTKWVPLIPLKPIPSELGWQINLFVESVNRHYAGMVDTFVANIKNKEYDRLNSPISQCATLHTQRNLPQNMYREAVPWDLCCSRGRHIPHAFPLQRVCR